MWVWGVVWARGASMRARSQTAGAADAALSQPSSHSVPLQYRRVASRHVAIFPLQRPKVGDARWGVAASRLGGTLAALSSLTIGPLSLAPSPCYRTTQTVLANTPSGTTHLREPPHTQPTQDLMLVKARQAMGTSFFSRYKCSFVKSLPMGMATRGRLSLRDI